MPKYNVFFTDEAGSSQIGSSNVGFLGSILNIDDVKWYGSGDVIIIHQDKK